MRKATEEEELTGASISAKLGHLRRLFAACNMVIGADMLPGDLEHAVRAERQHQDMFVADPGFRALSLHGKHGPWKDALHQAWRAFTTHGVPGVPGAPTDPGRVRHVHSVLLAAAQGVEEVPAEVRQAWTQHVGRNVCRHSGYLVLLQDLGVLESRPTAGSPQPSQSSQPGGVPGVVLDLSGGKVASKKTYCLVRELTPAVREKLSAYLAVADLLAEWAIPAPGSCEDWVLRYRLFAREVAAIPAAPHCSGGYRLPWLWRSACLARMRQEGRQSLNPCTKVSLAAFRSASPDQREWVDLLGQGDLSLQVHAVPPRASAGTPETFPRYP